MWLDNTEYVTSMYDYSGYTTYDYFHLKDSDLTTSGRGAEFDDVIVRLYLDPEPTVSAGTEQTGTKGVVPMNAGQPFYTITQNPMDPSTTACLINMTPGDSCDVTWQVNATGTPNTTRAFFTYATSLNYSDNISQANSSRINITIIANQPPVAGSISLIPATPSVSQDLNCSFSVSDPNSADTLSVNVTWYNGSDPVISYLLGVSNGVQSHTLLASGNTSAGETWSCGIRPYDALVWGTQINSSGVTVQTSLPPIISDIQCQEISSGWGPCSDIGFGETLTRVRVNCTDPDSGGSVANVTFNLTNIEDAELFFSNLTTNLSAGYLVLDHQDLTIDDSGGYNLTVSCTDINSSNSINSTLWHVPWGVMTAQLVSPAVNGNVTRYRFFNMTTNVTCTGGECGYLNATLDPSHWWDENWGHRKRINVTNNNISTVLEAGYTVNISMNTTGTKFLDNGSDVRVVYFNGSVNTELDRINTTAFNSSTTRIRFKLQKNISASGFDDGYYVYYSNPSAGAPPVNGTKVYVFYDDFSEPSIDTGRWTVVQGNWDIDTSAGSLRQTSSSSSNRDRIRMAYQDNDDWEVSFRIRYWGNREQVAHLQRHCEREHSCDIPRRPSGCPGRAGPGPEGTSQRRDRRQLMELPRDRHLDRRESEKQQQPGLDVARQHRIRHLILRLLGLHDR